VNHNDPNALAFMVELNKKMLLINHSAPANMPREVMAIASRPSEMLLLPSINTAIMKRITPTIQKGSAGLVHLVWEEVGGSANEKDAHEEKAGSSQYQMDEHSSLHFLVPSLLLRR